ncbi:MAG: VIT1/CCC1 transporter family protein [Saprospiraceae bacterium]
MSGHHHHHHEEHLGSSEIIKDVVIGMADGLTVPFALAAGLSGAVSDNHLIIVAGIAEIAAGAIAMGLGGYLSGQTELHHYQAELKREYWEIEHKRDWEIKEVKDIFLEMGLSETVADEATSELIKDDKKWVDFMMRHELGLEEPDERRASKSAFNIGISYIIGGIIPLAAYFLTDTPHQGLLYSSIITLICLFIFGYYRSKMTGQPLWEGATKTMIIGAIAAATAYVVAMAFGAA